ncbi:MAG: 8-amino-7-oxononanoate synthase [Sphingomonadaceae bacterium]|nr:8-amino-7-oxononanoate synthase [Sphingomonadaceae bacterium]
MSALELAFAESLDAIRARGEHRVLAPAAMASGGRLVRGAATLLDFASNDYLGLAQHPLLKERAADWARRYGSGAGASRLVSGTSAQHLAVEAKLAAFKKTEAALIFASGWQANAAVLPALIKAAPGTLVFADKLNHASLHHGIAAAGARQIRFRHNDLDHLAELLAARLGEAGPRLIVTESVFSMDGDRVDVARLKAIAAAHDAFIYLDEAHATGVLGPRGGGLSAAVPGGVDCAMGTFSKALGGFGAYIAGSRLLIDYLVNACSGLIFTTAPPPALLGAIDAALDFVPQMDAPRARLAAMGEHVRAEARRLGYDTAGSTTQIVPVVVGGAEETLALGRRLAEAGIAAGTIRPPTVPKGTSRLRLALRATHDDADIARLLAALAPVPCPA